MPAAEGSIAFFYILDALFRGKLRAFIPATALR